MVKVGLIGIGGMGRMHFNCYKNNPEAQLIAICDVDERKRQGDWSSIGLNIDTSKSDLVDLSGLKIYDSTAALIADPEVQLVDICLPTPQHAEVTIAALQAGKHVFCEKPMALSDEQCVAMQQAAEAAQRQLMIGHCLRYWPQYVKMEEIIRSGEYGKVLYARFHRSSATPLWSWNNWLATGSQSGGAVLDMNIHDVDTALWWFGQPSSIVADGIVVDDLPLTVDATWRYENGPLVYLHGSWDNNGGPFRMSFKVALERATVVWDSSVGEKMQLHVGQETSEIEVSDKLAYQSEIDDFVSCIANNRRMETVTPAGSRASLDAVNEELRQIRAANTGQ